MIDPEILIANLYEAALIPEKWDAVLEQFTGMVEGFGALLFVAGERSRWICTKPFEPIVQDWDDRGIFVKNPRSERAIATRHAGFICEQDVFTPEELKVEPAYNQVLYPAGVGWGAGTIIPVPTGEVLVFHVERTFERGPIERKYIDLLDRFRPHIARSVLLAAKMRLERAKAATNALNVIGVPAAMLGNTGTIHTANGAFNKLVPDVFQDRRGRLAFSNSTADALLEKALNHPVTFVDTGVVHSIPIPAEEGRPPYIVHLSPVAGAARDIFNTTKYLLIVTPVVQQQVPTAEVLQGLFDLTPAEARVARLIGEGKTTADIAAANGVSHETIRSQLKAVLNKTGLSRQIDLATLLAGKPILGAGAGD